MIQFLNCRDLGIAGTYLRSDYSVNCDSPHYQFFKIIAIFGILLFPVGIPLLYFFLIRYRRHPLVTDCAQILYGNFDKSWKYFEVYDLIRKLLLTSILLFIGTPDSPSRCLYLLIIDLISLNIISYCQPYFYFYDNFLATTFIIIEIMAFMIGLVITSEIYKSENYNYTAMFTTLIVMILTSVILITPVTFLLKLNIIRKEYVKYILNNTVARASFAFPSHDQRNTTLTTMPGRGEGEGEGGGRSGNWKGEERMNDEDVIPHEAMMSSEEEQEEQQQGEPEQRPVSSSSLLTRPSWIWLPQRVMTRTETPSSDGIEFATERRPNEGRRGSSEAVGDGNTDSR
jgi:hypothetical protein